MLKFRTMIFFLVIAFVHCDLMAADYGLVFSKKASMHQRWKQVYPIAKSLSTPEAQIFLERCANSKEWFMQLAALKSYDALYPKKGLEKSRRLLKDSNSLVVRSEAVEYIKKHGSLKDVALLFEALLSSKNFQGRRSLSIRPRIIGAIQAMDSQNIYKKRWKKLQNDSNQTVKTAARNRFNPVSF